jgi:hypothetical protein
VESNYRLSFLMISLAFGLAFWGCGSGFLVDGVGVHNMHDCKKLGFFHQNLVPHYIYVGSAGRPATQTDLDP